MPEAGRPELEQVVETPAVVPDATTVALEPAKAAPIAIPYGARSPEGLGGMRDVIALSSPGERSKFILQLQRTAGNAAVCRWLDVVRDRYAALHGAGAPDDVDEPRPR